MKIALIGATGFVGKAVLNELLLRKHSVVALGRNPEKIEISENVTAKKVDVYNAAEVTEVVKGNDAVISAFNAGWENPNYATDFLAGAKAIQEGVKQSDVKRLFVVGGAGSLYNAEGVQLVDTPGFPAFLVEAASAARDYFNVLKTEEDLDWTFLSPAIEMTQENSGTRKGVYRTGLENPVFDENGRSVISVEDMAIAIVDEIENAKFIKQRFTVGY